MQLRHILRQVNQESDSPQHHSTVGVLEPVVNDILKQKPAMTYDQL
jgi:hypothetical protein